MKKRCTRSGFATSAGLLSLAWSAPLLAHHPMGGEAPTTIWLAFLSGLGHPVIGIDHLAFIIAIGLLSALAGLRSVAYPAALVSATIVGALLHSAGISAPFAELVVAVSVVAAGVLLFRSPARRLLLAAPLGVVAAIFHGLAFGEAIVGAEPMPVLSYLVGFCVIQVAIGSAVFLAGVWVLKERPSLLPLGRMVGGAFISCVGLMTATLQLMT